MGNPHVLAIAYPGQGHVIPLLEFSQCLAKHGIKVTFVSTEYTHKRVTSALATKGGCVENQIHLVSVPLGLETPENEMDLEKHVVAVYTFLPRKVEQLIDKINASDSDKITCVLADHLLGWAMEISTKKGIRRAAFGTCAATLLAFRSSIQTLIDDGIIDNHGIPTNKHMFQLSPTIPPISADHFGWTSLGDKKAEKLIFEYMIRENGSRLKLAEWLLCNSNYDLEPEAFKFDQEITPIGPLLANNRFGDLAGSFWPEDLTCLKWLDQQPPLSVLYISFGSTTIFDRIQFQELAMGLELCNRPFLWVVRPGISNDMNEIYPKGFQDTVATRGHIVSWAPQQKVLGHPSIACFMSHCGWNSTLEGVGNGVPFLCLPYFGDQMHNANYICNVWKIGLGFNRDDRGIVTREEVKHKVQELLDDGNYRANALDLKEKVMNGTRDGGGSYNNFNRFVEWLKA